MPALTQEQAREALNSALVQAQSDIVEAVAALSKRINLPTNKTSPPGLIEANTRDPWSQSGKYALAWVYFSIILVVFAALIRFYHLFTDRIRTALHQEEVLQSAKTLSPDTDYELSILDTDKSTNKFFPRNGPLPNSTPKVQPSVSSVRPFNVAIAFFRYIFYRQIPHIRIHRKWSPIIMPSLAVTTIILAALALVSIYSFLPQPLYWRSLEFGSPPLAIRSGMLAIALVPWIVAMSMKANFISTITGIGHERLNVLHRWGGYLCLFLSLVHTVPFYFQESKDAHGGHIFRSYFARENFYVYGTGIAALVPLLFLCVHSLPLLRAKMYELFVALHVPVAALYICMLLWHCHNYLTSWHYLFATIGIWVFSLVYRLFFLNWANPWRMSWLIGDEAAVTILPENAVKITIPTQMKWRPGQYVYLRMPGISVFENHPFTIASLCSEDFPSEYGEGYQDMVLVFRPFGGFTAKVLRNAIEQGPWHTYRAFVDGPYGGMQRRIEAFDHVVLIAGGSGITAIVSQILDLIKRMRDGKAVTKSVQVIWAMKRPDTLEWFKEELRICREFAPPDSVNCQFFITAAKRLTKGGPLVSASTPTRPMSTFFHNRVDDAFQHIATKRLSTISNKRNSALIREEAAGDPEREKELRRENEDAITALPQAHMVPRSKGQEPQLQPPRLTIDPNHQPRSFSDRRPHTRNLSLDIATATAAQPTAFNPDAKDGAGFDFGFPSTPTEFQKNLMRFAFLPAAVKKSNGWSTEYGRPDIPYMLRQSSREWGRRTCVFVCGPPTMRRAVSDTIAELQTTIWKESGRDELFLHAENYAI